MRVLEDHAASIRLLAHHLEPGNPHSPIFVLLAGAQGKLLEWHRRDNELSPVADDHPPVLRGNPNGLVQLSSPTQELVDVSVDVEEFHLIDLMAPYSKDPAACLDQHVNLLPTRGRRNIQEKTQDRDEIQLVGLAHVFEESLERNAKTSGAR